jgi:hypothetical protein
MTLRPAEKALLETTKDLERQISREKPMGPLGAWPLSSSPILGTHPQAGPSYRTGRRRVPPLLVLATPKMMETIRETIIRFWHAFLFG